MTRKERWLLPLVAWVSLSSLIMVGAWAVGLALNWKGYALVPVLVGAWAAFGVWQERKTEST